MLLIETISNKSLGFAWELCSLITPVSVWNWPGSNVDVSRSGWCTPISHQSLFLYIDRHPSFLSTTNHWLAAKGGGEGGLTVALAFCIRMRCNLSAISSWKCYLAAVGHRSGNDSVLFNHCSLLNRVSCIELRAICFCFHTHTHAHTRGEPVPLMSSFHLEHKVSRRQSLRPLTSQCPSLLSLSFLSDKDNIFKVSSCKITSDIAVLQRENLTSSLRLVICRELHDESGSDADVTLCVLSDTGSNVLSSQTKGAC